MRCWRGEADWPSYSRPTVTAEDRFWPKVDRRGEDECWPWLASRYRNGYGQFEGAGAHRFAYELARGPIPDGLVIDHTCGQKFCVNPRHLEAVTVATNTRRGYTKNIAGTHRRALMAERTHCSNDHELTAENVYVTKQGWRQCKSCRREYARKRRLK
jgi:hypothetical protein